MNEWDEPKLNKRLARMSRTKTSPFKTLLAHKKMSNSQIAIKIAQLNLSQNSMESFHSPKKLATDLSQLVQEVYKQFEAN